MKFIKTHWKKSIFFSMLAGVGCNYGFNRYKEKLLLRQYCLAIQQHSLESLPPERPIKQVTILLNNSADESRCAKTFNKFALPMLSMSGVNFVVVPTSYEGHVSSLLKYLPVQTEALVVAGGDGMLQDTVTALLRSEKWSHLPLGYIPLGKNNTFIRRLLPGSRDLSHVDKICQSVINIVEGNVEKMPIMAITPGKGKTIYATSYFTWGSVKGAIDFIPKFWWTGRCRTMLAMLRYSASSVWPCNIKTKVNGQERELANLTVIPDQDSLLLQQLQPILDRMQFVENVGLNVNRQDNFLDQLTLHDPPPWPVYHDVTIEPISSEGKFFVDGEAVDCRTITIQHMKDSLTMFVPRNAIHREVVSDVFNHGIILGASLRSLVNDIFSNIAS